MKQIFITTFLILGFTVQAQNNTLLNRDFWKNKPDLTAVKNEIAKGNNPTELNSNAFDPTVLAINEQASNEVVKHLLTFKGNDVNKITHDKRTYIFWAAFKGNVELMEYLIAKGAKTNLQDSKGYSIMTFAASSGQANLKVYDLCIKNGIDPKKDVDYSGANALLLIAPFDNEMRLIDYFSSKGLDVKSKDSNGCTAADYAAKTGNINIIKSLLQNGVSVTDQAMIMASQGVRGVSNNLNVYQYLESLGINPNATNKNGENVLHFLARKEKQLENIAYFISKDVSVDQVDHEGTTPLMNAMSNDLETITLMLSYSKNINQVNKNGTSALAFAVRNNNAEVIKFLIQKGADCSVIDNNLENITSYLIQSYQSKKSKDFDAKLEVLKQNNINIAQTQKNGNTLYHLAIVKNDLDLLKRIASYSIDVNALNNEKMTVLHKAALTAKDDSILKYLVSLGAKKNIETDMGETAYDLAAENEHLTKNKTNLDFLK